MTTEALEFLSAYERIKESYKKSMAKADEAISHEENERNQEAIEAYKESLQLMNETFSINVGLPDNIDNVKTEWTDACKMIHNLKSATAEISYRLKMLHLKESTVDTNAVEAFEMVDAVQNGTEDVPKQKRSPLYDNPPTYYDITNANGVSKTYRQIINGLRYVIGTKDCKIHFDTIFQSPIKLYKIQSNGVVSAIAGETPMSIVMSTVEGEWQFLNGIFFIQCEMPSDNQNENLPSTSSEANKNNLIWIYPLIPNVTTCYRTNYGAFIFPDIETDQHGNSFGIMIIEKEESNTTDATDYELTDLQQFFLDLLEAILAGKVQQIPSTFETQGLTDSTSRRVSKGIVITADFIARNLVRGAEKTGELMIKGTPYVISKMSPAPENPPPMSTTLQTSVNVAKNVSGAAVTATSWMASKVGAASIAIGHYLAPHIQTHGATLLEKGFGYDSNEANDKMEGALTVIGGAVEGISTVYNGLETSAKILGNSLSENSVKIIEHKYGSSAGNVAAGTFETIGNAFNVSQNVNYITPKGIAKKFAKNTGKAVVDDYNKRILRGESQSVPAGALYLDLRGLKENP